MPATEAKAEIETEPAKVEAKINKCSTCWQEMNWYNLTKFYVLV